MHATLLATRDLTGALGRPSQHDMLAARQMQAMSFALHIPLVCFGIAFPAMVLFVEGLWLRTGERTYRDLAQRWSKVMLVLFAVGVVTGTIRRSSSACCGRTSWRRSALSEEADPIVDRFAHSPTPTRARHGQKGPGCRRS